MTRLSTTCALALTALLLAAPAMAADDVATVFMGPTSLSFQPQVATDGATLVVTGPGEFLAHYEFASAADASFEIAGDMVDGLYTYELVLHPRVNSVTRRAMDRARAADDDFAADSIAAGAKIRTLSGYFTVRHGAVVTDTLAEEAAAPSSIDSSVSSGLEAASGSANFQNINGAAQVFTTDVIVQGSECVGFDCTSSESFGFDTLRLKENNLRIHFQDTSASASFPSTDWRITANDTSNGGANYLAIQDATAGTTPFRVVGGAINNALYVDAEGDVGVGTSNPIVEVHAVDGNTPTYRLEQNGSSGFTPQTWDLAGNETNFFIRDVTNGSKLPFRIEPGAPDDTVYLEDTGDVGIGTDAPSAAVHVVRSGTANDVLMKFQNNNTFNIEFDKTDETDTWRIRRSNAGLVVDTDTVTSNNLFFDDGRVRLGAGGSGSESFLLQTNGDLAIAGALTQGSDRNSKQNIVPVAQEEILEKVMRLPIAHWEYKARPDVKHVGPMAQDFHALFGLGDNDRRIATLDTSGVALAAVQALNQKLQEKQQEIETLTQRLEALEAKLAQ